MSTATMTDRELLELAATAAGLHWEDFTKTLFHGEEELREWPYEWNPLLNDGNALRLAVRLEMQVDQQPQAQRAVAMWTDGHSIKFVTEGFGEDRYAATRRAIVRAAAAIELSRS